MHSHHSKPEVPPLEAYGCTRNLERFAPLHDFAAEVLIRLALRFDVERSERYGLDAELEQGYKLARPTLCLQPRSPGAACVAVAFSAFPGLLARFGRWYLTAFPRCGCDACNETMEGEAERLTSLINNMVAGRFRERIYIPSSDVPSTECTFWSSDGRFTRESSQLDPSRAQHLIADSSRSSYEWLPWDTLG
jgi:hypothetical protein